MDASFFLCINEEQPFPAAVERPGDDFRRAIAGGVAAADIQFFCNSVSLLLYLS